MARTWGPRIPHCGPGAFLITRRAGGASHSNACQGGQQRLNHQIAHYALQPAAGLRTRKGPGPAPGNNSLNLHIHDGQRRKSPATREIVPMRWISISAVPTFPSVSTWMTVKSSVVMAAVPLSFKNQFTAWAASVDVLPANANVSFAVEGSESMLEKSMLEKSILSPLAKSVIVSP